ncbi:fibronectin type III domain-containing protein [Streptosporangium sp. NPDC001681]|uniref:fibronectin type III domain-containing protein n=1 Tax=Streptosporangium sp. NPDC001681 TaxID=3154395 RepID=UPI00332E8457
MDGKRPFLSATPGAILQTALAEAQARGAVPSLDWDFDSTHDSAGEPWDKVLTIYYQLGTDVLTLLINLAEQGVCDWRMSGRTLQVYNADTELDRDLATGPAPVELRLGRDVVEAPDDGTLEDAASSVLVVGDNGFVHTFENPAALQPWGPWEQYVGHGGVSDMGTATLLAQAALERAAAERVQRTRGITVYGARWLPFRDYRPGDRVRAPGEGGALESLRVRQVALSRNADGVVGGSLILNDRFLERDIRLARRTAGIVGGSTADGGSGARPAPDSPRPRTPAAPTGLIVGPVAYLDAAGVAQGQITATWGAVIVDVSGVALDVGGYQVFMRVNTIGEPWFLVATTEADDNSATFSPLLVGQSYAFKVRAVNLGVVGAFSSQVAVTIPDDTTPPPVPTTPQLATRLGVVHVTWDGLGVGAAPMPIDFLRVRVWMQNPLAPGWTDIGYLDAAGSILVPGLPYGADRQFRFTSVDRSGNESAASTSATIATVPLVQGDAANSSITTGALVANAVTADKLAVGAVEAGHISAGAVTAGKLAAVLTLSTRLVAGDPSGARVELNSSGLAAYNASGVQTASIAASSGAVSIVGQLASGVTGARVVVNPAGASAPEIRFIPGSGVNASRITSDGSMYTGEATLLMESGTNAANTATCRLIHAAGFWRVAIHDPSTGNQRGGYVIADETQAHVGWIHPTSGTQMFLFSPAGTLHRGTWQIGGVNAGLIMLDVTITGNGTYHIVNYGFTLLTTPSCVWSAQRGAGATGSSAPADMYIYTRSQSAITFRSPSAPSSVVTFSVWAWRA